MRRALATIATTLVIVLGGLATSPAAPPLRMVRVTQAVASFAFLPLDVAKRAGYFAQEGLEVEQIETRGGGPDLAALLSGSVEFNAAAGTYQFSVMKQKRDLLNVCNFFQRNLIQVAMRKATADRLKITPQTPFAEKLRTVKGLTIGITRPGALTDVQARYVVRQAGLDPDKDTRIVSIGSGPALVAALERGDVDLIFISVPFAEIAVQRGSAIMFINNAAGEDPTISPFMMENIYVLSAFARKDPEVVTSFVRAVHRAMELMGKSTPELIADLVNLNFPTVERDVMSLGVRAVLPAVNPSCVLSRKAVENTVRVEGETALSIDQILATFTDEFIRRAKGGR